MPSEPDEAKADLFNWLIPQRLQTQELLLSLYRYRAARPDLADDPDARRSFGLLAGAAFSLWRAVFLAKPEREWASPKGILAGAVELLEKVLENNALLYGDEKRIENWSVGYYLNNAYYRLEAARVRLGVDESELPDLASTLEAGITSVSPQVACETAIRATSELIDRMTKG